MSMVALQEKVRIIELFDMHPLPENVALPKYIRDKYKSVDPYITRGYFWKTFSIRHERLFLATFNKTLFVNKITAWVRNSEYEGASIADLLTVNNYSHRSTQEESIIVAPGSATEIDKNWHAPCIIRRPNARTRLATRSYGPNDELGSNYSILLAR